MSLLLTHKTGQDRGSTYLLLFLCMCLSLLLTSCPEPTNNVPRDTTITLELLSTWTTSVRLNVAVTDTTDTWTFELIRDDSVVAGSEVSGSDTVVVDGGLNPGTEYSYRAFFIDEGVRVDTSETITAVTMDTTSHDFVWEIDTLGNYGSYLNDVTIVDENNIWVVGLIRTDDFDSTTGTNYTDYNAAHWYGSEWELELIGVPGVIGEGIYYFTEDDIWVTTGIIYHWNGEEWERYHLWDMGVLGPNDGGVSKIWGDSPSNVYFVGRKGSIVHYDGTSFRKMESGTDVDLQDVWGLDDEHVWAIGRNVADAGKAFLKLDDGQWKPVDPEYQIENLWQYSIWTDNLDTLYTTGSGWWAFSVRDSMFIDLPDFSNWVSYKIRGNTRNDIFTSGAGGEVMHYNGLSWWLYSELQDVTGTSTIWLSVDVKEDFVVVCGYTYVFPQTIAIVARGYRHNR